MVDVAEWGTFKDSLKAPVFGWFTYPAGFSFKAVEHSIKSEGLKSGDTIYDPFMGSGTTNMTAKLLGINSYGVEAHPFVYPIAKCKMNWSLDIAYIKKVIDNIREKLANNRLNLEEKIKINDAEFPELVLKCFLPETLYELLIIRNSLNLIEDNDVRLFMRVGLISVLRSVSIAATGWPYIAPNKIKVTSYSKEGAKTYIDLISKMCEDVNKINLWSNSINSQHNIFEGDSRNTIDYIDDLSVDHIFTSPPYLNNFDYADRTRLEMYFMGDAKSWGDICSKVRTKLMTSATTQISRTDSKYSFLDDFITDCPEVYLFLRDAVDKLAELRKTKGGKKSYDLLVLGYFNDMYLILKDNYRVLKDGKTAKYILGDSAPYGIHIPTDEIIGQIGVCVGFKSYEIDVLRARGGKWKNNPQRHNVALRETIITLRK